MSEEKNERVGKDKVDKRAGRAGRREKAVPETDNPFEKMRVSSKLQDVFDEKPRRKELFVPFYFAILMAYLELTFHIYTYRLEYGCHSVVFHCVRRADRIPVQSGAKDCQCIADDFSDDSVLCIFLCTDCVQRSIPESPVHVGHDGCGGAGLRLS